MCMHQNFFIVMWTSQHIWMNKCMLYMLCILGRQRHTRARTQRWKWAMETNDSVKVGEKRVSKSARTENRQNGAKDTWFARAWWALLTFEIFTFNLVCNMLIHVLAHTKKEHIVWVCRIARAKQENAVCRWCCCCFLLFAYSNFPLLSFVRHVIWQLPKIKK